MDSNGKGVGETVVSPCRKAAVGGCGKSRGCSGASGCERRLNPGGGSNKTLPFLVSLDILSLARLHSPE